MESWVWQVAGMSCTGCAQRLGAVLGRVEGVHRVVADHVRGRVEVRVDPDAADRRAVVERIEAAGFRVVEGEGRR